VNNCIKLTLPETGVSGLHFPAFRKKTYFKSFSVIFVKFYYCSVFFAKLQECTKKKAVMSIMMVRNIDETKARSIVDSVFSRCYADKEPFGRIPRGNSRDPERMLAEGEMYGYCN